MPSLTLLRVPLPGALLLAPFLALFLVGYPAQNGPQSPVPAELPGSEPTVKVQTGLDVLVGENFQRLRGRRVGIICNQTAVDSNRRHIVDLMAANPNVDIVALFGPEHGIRGGADEAVADSIDARTGLKVYSLYDDDVPAALRYRPTAAMLRGIDTLVFDIQDIGSRYYTYISTLGYVIEAAGQNHIKLLVLDRPNPLGGQDVEGPDLDLRFRTFAGYHNMPITHGMTVGELALLFNAERHLNADIEVVPMQGWRRSMFFDQTRLPWVNPSPNIRSPREAILYAGVGFLEDLPLSVGRGTAAPFEVIGAPWINGAALAHALNVRRLPGVTFRAVTFTPRSSDESGIRCSGIHIALHDEHKLHPSEMGIYIADALARLFPSHITPRRLMEMRAMIGNEGIPRAIAAHESPDAVIRSWSGDTARWRTRRYPFLLYQ